MEQEQEQEQEQDHQRAAPHHHLGHYRRELTQVLHCCNELLVGMTDTRVAVLTTTITNIG